MKQFREDGITFRYPESWRLDREPTDNGWTVMVQSPDTAFMVVSFDPDLPTTDEMADTALEALRADYPDLESEPHVDTLAGQMAVGHDVRFFSFDLTNTCWIRSFYGDAGTVLVLCQSNDLDLEQNEPVLRAICASMRVEE
jgi:hypothetical protein